MTVKTSHANAAMPASKAKPAMLTIMDFFFMANDPVVAAADSDPKTN